MSWRRLGVLIRQLPRTSRTHVAVLGDEWDMQTHLLATIADALHGANWQRTGKKSGQPKRIPRPGEEPKPKPENTVDIRELRRRLHPDEFPEGGDDVSQ